MRPSWKILAVVLSLVGAEAAQAGGKHRWVNVRVTVTDQVNKATATVDHKFVVLDKGFGIVSVTAEPVGFPGRTSGVRFEVVGMKRDSKEMFDVKVAMRIFDEQGKPTLQDPL